VKSISQQIEIASHIAIIIVAALISVVLVKTYLLPGSKSQIDAPMAKNAPIVDNSGPLGKKISLPDTNFETNGQTLVLALSTGCHFCTESAPFYKELIQKRASKNVRLLAVFPQPVDAGRGYLTNLGIAVDDVKQAQLNSIGVQGTPTLLLINKDGVVKDAWIGKLPSDKEREVISRL
jgi:redoxin